MTRIPTPGRKPHVCFVCPYAYPLFDPLTRKPFGGMEVRSWLFARGLARTGEFTVSFVTRCEGPPARLQHGEITVHSAQLVVNGEWLGDQMIRRVLRSVERVPGFPGVRIRVKRWHMGLVWELPVAALCAPISRLRQALGCTLPRMPGVLSQVGADVYCCFGVNEFSAATSTYARNTGSRSILFLAHEMDLSAAYRPGSTEQNTYGDSCGECFNALHRADRIVAQTIVQKDLLAARFGRECTVISNPYEFRQPDAVPDGRPPQFALWIGRSDPWKRPGLLLELAKRCPEIPFVMVFNPARPELHAEILAAVPSNVRVVERMAFSEMEECFGRAAVLVNTSDAEGFPNTFLQAAGHGVPIVSLRVDPDGFLSREGAGFVAGGDMDQMVAGLRALWASSDQRREVAGRLRAYLEPRHGIADRVRELADLLRAVLGADERLGRPGPSGATLGAVGTG